MKPRKEHIGISNHAGNICFLCLVPVQLSPVAIACYECMWGFFHAARPHQLKMIHIARLTLFWVRNLSSVYEGRFHSVSVVLCAPVLRRMSHNEGREIERGSHRRRRCCSHVGRFKETRYKQSPYGLGNNGEGGMPHTKRLAVGSRTA